MKVYLLIALALLLTTTGQVLQKLATSRVLQHDTGTGFIAQLLLIKETWWAIICLATGILVWLAVLYYMDVSKATPFLSFGYILVTLLSRYKLKEVIPVQRWLGVMLITIGLWVVSLS